MLSMPRFVGSALGIIGSVLLLTQTSVAAEQYDLLRQQLKTAVPVLDQLTADQELDVSEEQAEAGEEFFPVTAEEEEGNTRTVTEEKDYVTFRIAGVPYALSDVPVHVWFAPYVRDVAERGIVSGYRDASGIPTGIFGPERNVSIEELAKMAIEAALLPRAGCSDLKNSAAAASWSRDYIACAEQAGLAVYADGTVDLKRPATRAEVVMTILQGFGVQLRDIPGSDSPFSDVSASTLFSSAVYTASQDGIIAGYTDEAGKPTGEFGPDKPVNRAEVAKIISIALQVYGKGR